MLLLEQALPSCSRMHLSAELLPLLSIQWLSNLLEKLGDDLLEALYDGRVGWRRALAADDQVAYIPAQRRQCIDLVAVYEAWVARW